MELREEEKMKILFLGDLSSYARSRQRFQVMQDLGYLVKGIASEPLDRGLDISNKPKLWHRIRNKLGYPVDFMGINKNLLPALADFSPDLLWVEKTGIVLPSIYKKIRLNFPKVKIVYYSEDDIYIRNNRSSYLKNALRLFNVVFTTKPRNLSELTKWGIKKTCLVYQAYDQNFHRPILLSEKEKECWGFDVSFVGTFEKDRAEKMLFLAQNGIKVRVWGANWQSWQNKHPNLLVEAKPVYNEDFIKVINSTKINLNFLRKFNRDQHTSRSVEIPACQAFMLAERTKEHLELFEEGKEAEFFESTDELLKKIKYYLTHEDERQHIAKSGRERCLKSGYDHHSRIKFMLEQIFS